MVSLVCRGRCINSPNRHLLTIIWVNGIPCRGFWTFTADVSRKGMRIKAKRSESVNIWIVSRRRSHVKYEHKFVVWGEEANTPLGRQSQAPSILINSNPISIRDKLSESKFLLGKIPWRWFMVEWSYHNRVSRRQRKWEKRGEVCGWETSSYQKRVKIITGKRGSFCECCKAYSPL